MKIKEIYERVVNCPRFKKQGYLAHFFITSDAKHDQIELDDGWEIGFYDKQKDVIISYKLDKGSEEILSKEGKALKRNNATVPELILDEVKLDFNDAAKRAQDIQKEKYPRQSPVRTIFVLQKLKELPLWNITFITTSFNILNIKINATNGNLVSHELTGLADWKK